MKQDSIEDARRAEPRHPEVHGALNRLLAALPPPGTPHLAVPALAARHRAMVLIGLGGSLRHAEISALNIGDVTIRPGSGLAVQLLAGGAATQEGARTILIWDNPRDRSLCVVAAFERWMRFRRTADDWLGEPGADFPVLHMDARRAGLRLFCGISGAGTLMQSQLSDKMVRRLMKQACELAGLTETRLSRCSLRLRMQAPGSDAAGGRGALWWQEPRAAGDPRAAAR